jgi:putative sigma-54 modulation protein
MQISVTFRHMDPVEELKQYAFSKVAKVKKYFYNPIEANIILTREKHRNIAEVTLVVNRFTLKGQEETSDMYSAIDLAMDKIERQIKKHKDRIRRHKTNHTVPLSNVELEMGDPEGGDSGEGSHIVETKRFSTKPMSLDEAVLQMDILKEQEIFAFANDVSGEVNVLYRKKDGNYGLIIPEKE